MGTPAADYPGENGGSRPTATNRGVSFDPRTGEPIAASVQVKTGGVDAAVRRTAGVAKLVADTLPTVRRRWLRALADVLERNAREIEQMAEEETALGPDRLKSELSRNVRALRYYGDVCTDGRWLDAVIDTGLESELALRRANVALGPVAVFESSNFPFLFGALGHDTASAFVAGCTVTVKAHPAHPRLTASLQRLATQALREEGAPDGTLEMVHGVEAGADLVSHPLITAVAFTGSQTGGLALWRLANGRPDPIPFYAKLGTVNPAVITPAAAQLHTQEIAAGFVQSFTLGTGQYCTKPGLLFAPAGSAMAEEIATALARSRATGWMLTESMAREYEYGVRRLVAAGARVVAQVDGPSTGWGAATQLLSVAAADIEPCSPLLDECFGPVAILVEYSDGEELRGVLTRLSGCLTATVHGSDEDDPDLADVVAVLARVAGRVVVNDWSTFVAIGAAQHHGGPWPATTLPHLSVGAAAVHRWVRAVCYQNTPDHVLPPPLQDHNPWQIPRQVDGVVERGVLAHAGERY